MVPRVLVRIFCGSAAYLWTVCQLVGGSCLEATSLVSPSVATSLQEPTRHVINGYGGESASSGLDEFEDAAGQRLMLCPYSSTCVVINAERFFDADLYIVRSFQISHKTTLLPCDRYNCGQPCLLNYSHTHTRLFYFVNRSTVCV